MGDLTVEQFCRLTNLSERAARQHIRDGRIPSYKIGCNIRIPAEAVDARWCAMTLDPKSEAWVDRLVESAPPLSQKQRDLIATAFRGAITDAKRAAK